MAVTDLLADPWKQGQGQGFQQTMHRRAAEDKYNLIGEQLGINTILRENSWE